MDRTISARRLLALLSASTLVLFGTTGCPGPDEEEDPCEEIACDTPPANVCDGDVVVTFGGGTCTDGECTYFEIMRTPCSADETCQSGACVPDENGETCADVTCDDPPADRCDGNVRVVYPATGTCTDGASGPECTYTPTPTDCADDEEVCTLEAGSPVCVDLCEDVDCDPRDAHCDGATAVNYGGAAGTCDWETGACDYPTGDESTVTCEAHQQCVVDEGTAACEDLPETCEDHGPCVTPPGPHCSVDGIVTYAAEGDCDDTSGYAVCTYAPTTEACDDPDAADYCDGDVLHVWNADGACELDETTPVCVYETDETDCAAGGEVCDDDGRPAACVVDPDYVLCETACTADTECGRAIDHCVVFDEVEGGHCTLACQGQSDCPDDYTCESVTSVDGATENQCVPDVGYCTEPNCYEAANCAHPFCSEHAACQPGFNYDFEDWTRSDPPAGFWKDTSSSFAVLQETNEVNTGLSAARFETSAGTTTRWLGAFRRNWIPAEPDVTYTLHQWTQFHGPYGWYAQAFAFFDQDGDRIGNRHIGPILGDIHDTWRENTHSTTAPAGTVLMKPALRTRHRIPSEPDEADPSVTLTDDWAVTVPYTFDVSHTDRDGGDADVKFEGNRFVSAGINNAGVLYAATNGAADGYDRMLFVWVGGAGTGTVPAPWSKAGNVAGPAGDGVLLVLVQEEAPADGGYCEWRIWDADADGGAGDWEQHGVGRENCSGEGLGDILSGTVDLAELLEVLPREVPSWIAFASAGYETADDGALVPSTQVPAASSDPPTTNIDPDETELVHRARLLTGKIHD